MNIALSQINTHVGDIFGNTNRLMQDYKKAVQMGADIMLSHELVLFGYPPRDLLKRPHKLKEQEEFLQKLIPLIGDTALVIGVAEANKGAGKPLFNSMLFIHKGKILHTWRKQLVPNYDVFEEELYFEQGNIDPYVFMFKGEKIAMLCCEDIWGGAEMVNGHRLYANDPIQKLTKLKPDLLLVCNGSPYYWGKGDVRLKVTTGVQEQLKCAIAFANQVGGNVELVFDGRSHVLNRKGACIAVAKSFAEDLVLVDTHSTTPVVYASDANYYSDLLSALVLGTRDYTRKTGHEHAVIGLSGGIDSALTAVIAQQALGAENVTGVLMPSPYSSGHSVTDALALAANLDIKQYKLKIDNPFHAIREVLMPVIGWNIPGKNKYDPTEENVQARLRMIYLFALSNRMEETLVLTTGNKSESSVGYCTLYGDMGGGYSVLKDVYKTIVFGLSRYINRQFGELIPQNTITKPPSAELSPDQKDTDSLPPYNVLDSILVEYIERDLSVDQIVKKLKLNKKIVQDIAQKVDRNEYKRRQAAPGIIVTPRSFGFDRRLQLDSVY